ncbi:MAG TPA: hypothetical protein VIL20_00850 [Sandaracinaceae bacterium]
MSSRWETAGPPALVLVLALARIAAGDPLALLRGPAASDEGRASEPARAVLGGLAAGDAVGPLSVDRIAGPRDGEIAVELRGEECGIRAWIARRGSKYTAAPVRTERFELVFGPPPPGQTACEDEVALEALRALAARIEGGDAPVPDDM